MSAADGSDPTSGGRGGKKGSGLPGWKGVYENLQHNVRAQDKVLQWQRTLLTEHRVLLKQLHDELTKR